MKYFGEDLYFDWISVSDVLVYSHTDQDGVKVYKQDRSVHHGLGNDGVDRFGL